MTRRERLESKLARREEWAEKAEAKSEQRFEAVHQVADAIPFGQPILIGHHSERHARRDAERIRNGMDKAVELSKLAQHHDQKAAGIAAQLERSVFSDDENAIAELEKRIETREAECAHRKAVNAAWRKLQGDKPARLAALVKSGTITAAEALEIAKFFGLCHWEANPFPAYANTNARGSIRRDRERIEEIKRRTARAAEAEAAGGVAIVDLGSTEAGTGYTRVTFAEKPEALVLEALRTAGYRWGGGSWVGETSKLPDCLKTI